MNKEDIKKALECCITLKAYSCKECPYGSPDCNIDKLHTDALNLITEQEKDIKQLKTECALLDDELRIARQDTIDVLNELRNRLVVYYPSVISEIDELLKEYEE